MKLVQLCCVLVVLAGTAALALGMPSALYGEAQTPRDRDPGFMMLRGQGSRIGVSVRDVDTAALEKGQVGVVVESVRPDSPAARAGLRSADIVVEFDGERVRSAAQFSRLVQETPPGRIVQAAVLRDGRRTELSITPEAGSGRDVIIDGDRIRAQVERALEAVPDFEFALSGLLQRGRLGASVQELTPELAAYFAAKDGVLVASVESDSPAARAGLKAGDVIVTANGATISSHADLQRAIRDTRADAELKLGIVRDKKESSVAVTIEPPQRQTRPGRPVRLGRRSADL